jgi:hypothetical protein
MILPSAANVRSSSRNWTDRLVLTAGRIIEFDMRQIYVLMAPVKFNL